MSSGMKQAAMQRATRETYIDIKTKMSYITEEEVDKLSDMQYGDSLMEALCSEKKSVSELILLMDDMITNLQEHMDREDEEGGDG